VRKFTLDGVQELATDVLSTHCGGKQRAATLAAALRLANVPVRVIVDLDVLRNGADVQRIVESLNGTWDVFENDWKVVHSYVEASGFRPQVTQARERITDILDAALEARISAQEELAIRNEVRIDSGWDRLKTSGVAGLPGGHVTQAVNRLLDALAALGVHVVPVGELERFVPDIGAHGPAWVTAVHKAGRHEDKTLTAAREFVARSAAQV